MASNNIKQLDPVQGLVDYVLDVKPFHTKVIEVLIEYVHEDTINVIIADRCELKIDIVQPVDLFDGYAVDGFDMTSFSDPVVIPIVTPNPTNINAGGFEYGFNILENSFAVNGNKSGDFKVGTTIQINTFVEDFSNIQPIFEVITTNPGGFPAPAGTNSFKIIGDFTSTYIPGFQFKTFGSEFPDSTYTVSSIGSTFDGTYTLIPVDQSVVDGSGQGSIGLIITSGNNTGTFTVSNIEFSEGSIDSWPDINDPSSYITGNNPHTIITVIEPLNDPLLAFDPLSNQTYSALVILSSVPFIEVSMISFKLSGNYVLRFVKGKRIKVFGGTLEKEYMVVSSSFANGITEVFVTSSLFDTGDGHQIIDVTSGFTVSGDLSSIFVSGAQFVVVNSSSNDNFYIVDVGGAVYDNITNQTFIPVTNPLNPIIDGEIFYVELGVLKEVISGYDGNVGFNSILPESYVHVNIDERLKIEGLYLDLPSDVIDVTQLDAMKLDVNIQPSDQVQSETIDNLQISNELLASISKFNIISTNAALNTFTIRYNDPLSGQPVDVSDSFPPGTIFKVIDSYGDNLPGESTSNNSNWVVSSVTFNSPNVIIEIDTDFNNIPPYTSFNIISITNSGQGIPGNSQILFQGDVTNIFNNWGSNQFRLSEPLIDYHVLRNVITINNVELDAGNTLVTIDEEFNNETFSGLIGLIDVSYMADILFDSAINLWTDGSIIKSASTSSLVASTSITDTINFGWGTTHRWSISATDAVNQTVLIDSDITGILDIGDVAFIQGSDGNDGQYEIISFTYLSGPNQTSVVLDMLATDPPNGFEGYLTINDIDITNWFQYLIKKADSGTNTFEVIGNAINSIQVGQMFRVMGTQSNNGVYTLISPPVFDGATTIITVNNIDVTENGGRIESYRDYGIRIVVVDSINVQVAEESNASILTTSGSFVGSWDYPNWDIGSYDESLGTVIRLYSNSF